MREETRARAALIALLLASVVLVALDLREGGAIGGVRGFVAAVVGPVERAAGALAAPLVSASRTVLSFGSAAEREESLNASLRQLAEAPGSVTLGEVERRQVDELLASAGLAGYRVVPARVVAYSSFQRFSSAVTLDVGSSSGLSTDMAVITGQGLAGKVVSIGPNTATVQLISDPSMVMGVRAGEAQQAGFALPAGGRSGPPRAGTDGGPTAGGTIAAGSIAAGSIAAASIAAGSVRIRLFGSFAMTVDGRPVGLGGMRPRPRAVLRFLALHAGRPVHREVLQETFWPDADPETGAKSLHVALSALRRELAPHAGRGACELLVRDGDAYRLAVPDGARIDLVDFERAVAEARTTRARGASAVAIEAFRAALAAYGGDLLPEDGPAEWAANRRERARAEAVETARALAELLLDGDPTAAAEACAAGLALDAHHDPLWRILVEARERAGDPAAATSARSGYARMLAELGVATGDDA